MAWLIGKKGEKQGDQVPLPTEGTFMIGRNKEKCQLVLRKDNVSREHAVISERNGGFFIENKSKNKTFLDGKNIQGAGPVLMHDGVRIRICDEEFDFRDELPEDEYGSEEESSSKIDKTVSHSGVDYLEGQPAKTLGWLLDLTTELTDTLAEEQLLPNVVDKLLQLYAKADRAFLFQIDAETGKLYRRIVRTRDEGNGRRIEYSRTLIERCLREGEAILGKEILKELPTDSVIHSNMASVMCAPLRGRAADPLGVVQLDTVHSGKKFTDNDVKLLMAVARQTGIALENVKAQRELVQYEKVKQEIKLAQEIQYGLLPQGYPNIAGYEFAAFYQAAEKVGGDYYDFIPMADGKVAALLGDVAGHGIAASLLMAKVSSAATYAIQSEPNVGTAMAKLNNVVLKISGLDRYLTLAAALIDPVQHTVVLANAGHNPPLLFSQSSGEFTEVDAADSGGLPLGIDEGQSYGEQSISLAPGDSLLIYSDGVPDAVNRRGNRFGMPAVLDALRKAGGGPRQLVKSLVQALNKHGKGCDQYDDITIVCFGRNPQ